MIARIQGTVIEASPLRCVLDINGIGYEIHIPVTTAEKIPPLGQSATLFIHAVYREDSATLYGFATNEDRDFFRLLVERVSGIGPKIGISILSRMSVDVLRSAIASSDIALLSKCPGIGKKTAERIVVDLRDHFGKAANWEAVNQTTSSDEDSKINDAVMALAALGFKSDDAHKSVKAALAMLGDSATVEDLVRAALKK